MTDVGLSTCTSICREIKLLRQMSPQVARLFTVRLCSNLHRSVYHKTKP